MTAPLVSQTNDITKFNVGHLQENILFGFICINSRTRFKLFSFYAKYYYIERLDNQKQT